MGLKNISFSTLLGSKTFWAGVGVLIAGCVKAYATYKTGDLAGAINEAGLAIAAFVGAIGIKDATSGPVN